MPKKDKAQLTPDWRPMDVSIEEQGADLLIRLTAETAAGVWEEVEIPEPYCGPQMRLLTSGEWCLAIALAGEGASARLYAAASGEDVGYVEFPAHSGKGPLTVVTLNHRVQNVRVVYPTLVLDVAPQSGHAHGLEILWPDEWCAPAPDLKEFFLERRSRNR